MRILGVDPGTFRTGYGMIREQGGALGHVECGVIRTHAAAPLAERLAAIYGGLEAVIRRHRPDAVSVENIFLARNVRSALKLGHARGAVILAAVHHHVPVFEYTPAEVKKAVTGSGRADKEQVQEMVRRLLLLAGPRVADDASDALALAICHSHFREMQARLARAAAGR